VFLPHFTSMASSRRRAVRPVAVLAALVIALLVLAAPALAGTPTAHVDAPTDVTLSGATVNGTINPHGGSGGQGVLWDFGDVLEPGIDINGPHELGYPASASNEDQHVSIQVDPAVVEFLRANERNTFYWDRAGYADTWVRPSPTLTVKYGLDVAYNPYGPAHVFKVPAELTLPGPTEPPAATTGPASVVNQGEKAIVLTGTLDLKHQGFPKVGFEIGESKTYGALCGLHFGPGSGLVPGGAQAGQVKTGYCKPLIDALKMLPGTVLHYRVVADNGAPGGPVHGADAKFVVPGRRASALSRSLVVMGPDAVVLRIVAKGGYAATFKAPGAGTAQITWSIRSGGKTVTVAKGKHKAAGKTTFTVKLTKQGRALLTKVQFQFGRTLKLTAKGRFVPKKGKARSATRQITLETFVSSRP
jgi:hypothetical protein